jgi:hypothetical protein
LDLRERKQRKRDWIKINNSEFLNLYYLRNVSRAVKSNRMPWAGQVARRRQTRDAYKTTKTEIEWDI